MPYKDRFNFEYSNFKVSHISTEDLLKKSNEYSEIERKYDEQFYYVLALRKDKTAVVVEHVFNVEKGTIGFFDYHCVVPNSN